MYHICFHNNVKNLISDFDRKTKFVMHSTALQSENVWISANKVFTLLFLHSIHRIKNLNQINKKVAVYDYTKCDPNIESCRHAHAWRRHFIWKEIFSLLFNVRVHCWMYNFCIQGANYVTTNHLIYVYEISNKDNKCSIVQSKTFTTDH